MGGRKQDSDNYTLNRAYQSYRQPGSSIKPLLVYTPQLERGYTPDTVVDDHKLKDGPSNANNTYAGKIPLRYAVAHSINTIAWQLYDELTPKAGLQYLKNMNFAQIKDGDYTLATSLGGFTKGVSPLEMASGYAAVENDGLYREPTCVKSIVDSDENVVYTSSLTEKTVYKQDAARMMTDIMTSVMDSGTGRSAKLADMPCAGKTGTTNDHKDGWFCGFTRYYTTAVWVGCDYPKAISNLSGSTYPAQIWKAYMSAAHEGLSSLDFLPYAQLSDDFKNQQKQEEEELTGMAAVWDYLKTFLIIFCVVFAMNKLVYINAVIPSESMQDTIMKGDRVLGNRLAYIKDNPERYDIVIFKYPDDPSKIFIKRVIGLPGETVTVKDGKIYIDGKEQTQAVSFCPEEMAGSFGPYEVPEDSYFVMGDNRNNSLDSRYWDNTYVKKEAILAKAGFRYWPLNKVGFVNKSAEK